MNQCIAFGRGSFVKPTSDDLRLGALLQRLFALPDDELQSALLMSHRTGMPLGSVLIMQGVLVKTELRALIHAQSLLKDHLVDEQTVVDAIKHLRGQPLGIEGALKMMRWYRDRDVRSNRLGELLLAAKVLTQLELAKGLAHHHQTMEPLGRTLARLGSLTKKALEQTLAIQEQIRRGVLSRVQGIELIQDICSRCEIVKKADRVLEELVETIVDMPARIGRPSDASQQIAKARRESFKVFVNENYYVQNYENQSNVITLQNIKALELDAVLTGKVGMLSPGRSQKKCETTQSRASAFIRNRRSAKAVQPDSKLPMMRTLRKVCVARPAKQKNAVSALLNRMFHTIRSCAFRFEKKSEQLTVT